VGQYIHSPIRVHGVLLNQLSTGTTLPFYLYFNVIVAVLQMQFLPSERQFYPFVLQNALPDCFTYVISMCNPAVTVIEEVLVHFV
jgi:hypothetical protein